MGITVILVDGDNTPRPSLDLITNCRLNNPKDLKKLLKDKKIPLERIALSDKTTGLLYAAEGNTLSSVHDPWTGDQIRLHESLQTYIGSLELSKTGLSLHSVFANSEHQICIEDGMVCELREVKCHAWTTAMLESTFEEE